MTIHVKLGDHRGKKRLWVEGRRLREAGWLPGQRFRVELEPDARRLTIIADAYGNRRVSGKAKGGVPHPVIDLNGQELAATFGADTGRVALEFTPGRIVATAAQEEPS